MFGQPILKDHQQPESFWGRSLPYFIVNQPVVTHMVSLAKPTEVLPTLHRPPPATSPPNIAC